MLSYSKEEYSHFRPAHQSFWVTMSTSPWIFRTRVIEGVAAGNAQNHRVAYHLLWKPRVGCNSNDAQTTTTIEDCPHMPCPIVVALHVGKFTYIFSWTMRRKSQRATVSTVPDKNHRSFTQMANLSEIHRLSIIVRRTVKGRPS